MGRAWRLARNRYTRRAYERCKAAGVTATVMTEYVRSLDDPPDPSPTPVAARTVDPERVRALDAPLDERRPDEAVVGAFADGRPVGYLFCSLDATLDVRPLERPLSFDGAYLRRVFVSPRHRQRGVATALVARACAWAADRGAARATALVARDNAPSRALFDALGFAPVRHRAYARLGPFSRRVVRRA